MRYDTPIFLQKVTSGEYDSVSGNYGKDIVNETKRYANITDSGVETLKLIYGELKQGSQVIRLQKYYDELFDRIRVGNKIYRVDFSRKLKGKHVFVVSEVQ